MADYDNPITARQAGIVAQGSVLLRTTESDRGIIEKPMLTPHLDFHVVGSEAVLLVSEISSILLHGQRYLDLLPLLDGTRTRHEIAAALSEKHKAVEVQTTLVSMASKGYAVSSEFDMGRDQASFWGAVGVSPRWAEARLRAARVKVTGGTNGLVTALDEMGLAVTEDDPTLAIVTTNDYLSEKHAEINKRHRKSGIPWVLLKSEGVAPMFGPVFRPGDGNGPCWSCLAHRIRGNREVENFLRTVAGDKAAVLPGAGARPFARAVCSIAATEIAKWVVLDEFTFVHDHVISLEPFSHTCERHEVRQRPQCATCGDETLNRTDRPVKPVQLHSSPKPVCNSGGLRSVPPEETVRKYRHLVSPVSGVVTQLARITQADDPWLHVYWAGSNLALQNNSFRVLHASLRTKSSGKGSTPEQAEASALCEAVERYSGVFHGDEVRHSACLEDFADGEAIHPNEIQLFSDWQYEHAAEINARNLRFNYVPKRFDSDIKMDWSPVWSMTKKQHRYLPTAMLYYAKPLQDGAVYCGPDSNGCAAGNTLEEAILQGFFELVERDAFACWWYNRVRLPELDLDSFGDRYLSDAYNYYASVNRSMWVLDATHDFGIPVFVAVSHRTDKEVEDIIFSAGAHFDPHVAAARAVCELNQYLSGVRDVKPDGSGYLYDDPENNWWWKNAKLENNPYLTPDSKAPRRGRDDYPVPDTRDLRDDVKLCQEMVERKGMEFLVLDQTRPDIGMPVAKTIVPGMRHFWARLGPGRLFDVPVELGWLDKPTAEKDLNPVAVFI